MKKGPKRKRQNRNDRNVKFLSPRVRPDDQVTDRDLSWLEFNRRVLYQSTDPTIPLLDRIRFVGIFQSNLDEFFMKRMRLLTFLEDNFPSSNLTERVSLIRKAIEVDMNFADRQYVQLLKELQKQGVSILGWDQLQKDEKTYLSDIFTKRVFPVLTPVAVDPGHPFPHISNLSTSLAVALRQPGKNERLFSRIKIPRIFPLLQATDDSQTRWILLSDIIINNLSSLYPKMTIEAVFPFRVIRNMEIELDEETAEDLIAMMENELRERRFGEVVKLEYPADGDPWLRDFLKAELEVLPREIFLRDFIVDFSALESVIQLPRSDLKYKTWTPLAPPKPDDPDDFFSQLSNRDLLVHHPYESFSSSTEALIQTAADDPKVLGIKLTLYRTAEDSSLIKALIRAAEKGKQVVCIVELKARFDEERNLSWATALEAAGVYVVYGIVGLKTHAKVTLVARREGLTVKCYAHIGTGNYNSQTAKLYTDFGLLTGNPQITGELVEFFHFLTGRSLKTDYEHLLVAPVNMKQKILGFIENEVKNSQAGLPARIIIQCNNLEDQDITTALYKASQTGVKVDLLVRSICTLRPGTKELSANIRVLSIVDRFLEHSRVLYFRNGEKQPEDGLCFIGSADLMYRNLLGRVEVAAPISHRDDKARILKVLEIYLNDRKNGWQLNSDGSYTRLLDPNQNLSAQEQLMEFYQARHKDNLT